jgi:hypothetical protein
METLPDPKKPTLDICAVAASPFMRQMKKELRKVYAVTLYEINTALDIKDLQETPLEEVIPNDDHVFILMFSKVIATALTPHRPYKHKIKLQEAFKPPFRPIYSLSHNELEVFKECIEKNLSKGFIRSSS